MKKTTLALAIAVASLTTVANAALPSNTWYVGGKIGWSQYFDLKANKVEANDTDRSNVGGGAFLGFQANPYLAFELGYDWLGTAKYKRDNASDSKLTTQGVSLTGKLSYPISFISDDLDIYARAGAFITMAKWKGGLDGYPGVSGNNKTDTDISPVYALGLDYRFSEDFSARLEYQWVNHIRNDSSNVAPNNGLLSLGVTYSLGSPAVPVKTKVLENRYVLNDDVLFPFGKSELKADGQAALDTLVSTLVKLKPSESTIVVLGHTDRIGSDTYNQKLSDQRAKSVMSYLVAKGVPSDLISARGEGKSNPVTGNKCNALRGADLKTCLAPDRRVEIEIKAISLEKVRVNNN